MGFLAACNYVGFYRFYILERKGINLMHLYLKGSFRELVRYTCLTML